MQKEGLVIKQEYRFSQVDTIGSRETNLQPIKCQLA
jgi:hypothetical protein